MTRWIARVLAWLPSSIGGAKVLAVLAIVAAVVFTGAYLRGRVDGAAGCKAEVYAAQNAQLRKQLDFYRWLANTAAKRATDDANELSILREQVEDYANALEADAEPFCALSADDARRLRAIR